jgi:hypothetical protein
VKEEGVKATDGWRVLSITMSLLLSFIPWLAETCPADPYGFPPAVAAP